MLSLIVFLASVWVMFMINTAYTLIAFGIMVALYLYIDHVHKHRKGISSIFANTLFQINRSLQLFLQKSKLVKASGDWRPSAICISKSSFERDSTFKLTNWISYKYGFGTYLHRIDGYYSKATNQTAQEELAKLIRYYGEQSHVYVDTIISPSYTSAIAQSIQIPGISGMENNMLILEYDKENPIELDDILDNFRLVNAGNFDVCILASSRKPIIFKNGIHVWIKTSDEDNANLMIILSFILLGHPDWKQANIRIFNLCKEDTVDETREQMKALIENGRLPITLEVDVAIVGGGPSGLVASYYLAKKGLRVALYERKNAPGGGMWGGAMMFNEIIVQSIALPILEEFGIEYTHYKEDYYTLDSVQATSSLIHHASKAGVRIFNNTTIEDVVFQDQKVAGIVLNWAPVQLERMHIDPLVIMAKAVIDGTGHDCDIARTLERKNDVRLNTSTGKVIGERSLSVEEAERTTVENTKEIYPGLYVCGMASNGVSGGFRMGPIFGGMLLSGKKVAELILDQTTV